MSPFPTETLEIDAQGRESLVLDVALPVLGAWATSARVVGFRPSMGVSGLSPREVARLRTLGLATASKATGTPNVSSCRLTRAASEPLATKKLW